MMKVLFTSLLVATGVQAFDMPKLMAHLADPAEGVRVLSELPSGSCLTDILDLSFDYSQLKDGSSVLTDSTPLIFEGVDGAGTLDLWICRPPLQPLRYPESTFHLIIAWNNFIPDNS